MNAFRKRIRQSLANPILQTALDANAQRRVDGSVAAFASLPDYQERRQRAHEIRKSVITNLDEVVAQFLAKVEGNGIIVHRAKNATEAVEISLQIMNSAGARHTLAGTSASPLLIAKSKSIKKKSPVTGRLIVLLATGRLRPPFLMPMKK